VNAKVDISKPQDKVAMVYAFQDAQIMKIGSEIDVFVNLDSI
jgi:hypothetical protein